MASPLIQDGAQGKELKLRFDVSRYAPEEIVVKTVDNRLQVGEETYTNRYRVFVSTNFSNVTTFWIWNRSSLFRLRDAQR